MALLVAQYPAHKGQHHSRVEAWQQVLHRAAIGLDIEHRSLILHQSVGDGQAVLRAVISSVSRGGGDQVGESDSSKGVESMLLIDANRHQTSYHALGQHNRNESEESRWVGSCLSSRWEPKLEERMVNQTRWICVEATKIPSSKTHLKQFKKWCDVH